MNFNSLQTNEVLFTNAECFHRSEKSVENLSLKQKSSTKTSFKYDKNEPWFRVRYDSYPTRLVQSIPKQSVLWMNFRLNNLSFVKKITVLFFLS